MISVQSGCKWWILAKPKQGSGPQPFCSIDIFLNKFDVEAINDDRWEFEAILLTPGTKLFMRPNTPHYVFTPLSSICHGGHFYATSTIRDTCYGVVHASLAGKYVTNTEHELEARELLRRLVTYYHSVYTNTKYPNCTKTHAIDLTTFEGCVDFLALSNLAELANILYGKTYLGGISLREHLEFVETRRLCREVLTWHHRIYSLHGKYGKSGLARLQQFFMHGQLKGILEYQKRIDLEEEASGSLGDRAVNLGAILRQIKETFGEDTDLLSEVENRSILSEFHSHFETSIGWPENYRYTPLEKGFVLEVRHSPSDGKTLGDMRFEARLDGDVKQTVNSKKPEQTPPPQTPKRRSLKSQTPSQGASTPRDPLYRVIHRPLKLQSTSNLDRVPSTRSGRPPRKKVKFT